VPSQTKHPSSGNKVREHRARLRAQGLRPIQIWVPDTRSRHFAEQAHRQSLAVAASPHAAQDQDFIEAISGWPTE
jgi:hypothetical protein